MFEERRIGLALSGGGFRAAAFHLGVLKGLRQTGLLDRIDVVSGVSGGAMLAAAWVVARGEPFEQFEARTRAFLARDLKGRVLLAALRPDRALRLLADPGYSLTEVMAAVLDRKLYRRATLGALRGVRPRLVVNATCVNHGTGWRFTPDRIGDWKLETADRAVLDAFPLARAVVASAAFPGGFAPVALRAKRLFPQHRQAPREVLLTDGGVDDNLGVHALLAEECTALVVSDGSFPFADEARPLDRFGLPPLRRAFLAATLLALGGWGASAFDLPAAALALVGFAFVAVTLRLRFALWLFGNVTMRGQRRELLRRVFARKAEVPALYVGLSTALASATEERLRARGIDLDRLRRVATDLDLARDQVDGLVALGEALILDRIEVMQV